MYSIVLMAAVSGAPGTTGADATPVVAAPAATVVAGCTGCNGYAGYASSCSGSCWGSCHGSCHGGGFLGMRSGCCGGGFLGHKHSNSCHGCCGGYSYGGGYAYGCYGSGWGSCHGYGGYSYGCWGSCTGYGYGCTGSVYGTYSYPMYPAPPAVVVPTAPIPKSDAKPETKGNSDKGASLKFRLPANAALYVDGRQTGGDGTERSFFTPPLAAGQKYFYDVRAEVVVDGKTVTEEKRVVVEAGADLTESFAKLFAAAGGNTTVAGK